MSFTITGLTVFLMSETSAPAEIMTVPGENTFVPSGYFWVIERLSFPVGMFIPSTLANSLQASTALYSRASSPGFLAGHIQLAESETLSSPFFSGAQMILVSASATDSTDPASGLISAA